MLLQEIEPFAWGYYESKSENIAMRIAAGMAAQCRYLPIGIEPEVGLPWIDRRDGSFVDRLGVTYTFGDGIVYKAAMFDEHIEKYPEHREALQKYKEFFASRDTYSIFRATFSDLEKKLMDTHSLWGGTWGGHSNPDYGMLLSLGTSGLRKKIEACRPLHPESAEWYEALLLVLDGIDLLGDRFTDYVKNRPEYAHIGEALQTVPRKPANDFTSALVLFYLVFTLDGKDSPGTFDQYMIPYYKGCDKEKARKLLEGLWRGFHLTRAWNLCIGGSDEHFNDLSNELTWEILDLAEKFRYNTPNLTMRIHRNTPEALLCRAAEVIGTGIGMPALYNDDCVCPALEALGIPAADSHLYAMNGCNQIDIQGKSHMGLEDGEICLLKCLEFALFNGENLLTGETLGLQTGDAAGFKTFDELMAAYKMQVEHAIQLTVSLSNRSQQIFSENAPNPLRSLLIQGCIEKGKDYKSGGPVYNHGQILTEALADTTDALAVLRHFVFETRRYSMAEVLDALRKDYEGEDEMYLLFRNFNEKFGNDIESVDSLGGEILNHFFSEMSEYRTFRDPVNGIYGGGLSTFQRTGVYGSSLGASANGRHARGTNIADSVGPVPGMDKKGPTAVLNSALHYDQRLAKSGFVLQLKFDKHLFNTPKGKNAFVSLVKGYFSGGGQQLSINVLDREELLDAKKHPENHPNLIVRVGGFSELFNNLSEDLQDNVIARTMMEI